MANDGETVFVPGHGELTFPPGMSDEQKAAAIRTLGPPPQAAAPPERNYAIGEVPKAALENTPRSAKQLAGSIWDMVTNPVQTVKTVGDLASGVISKSGRPGDWKLAPGLGFGESLRDNPTPERIEERKKTEATADAMGEVLTKRFGGWENIKRTMAEDPVGFLTDVAGVFTGGGGLLAKAPGLVGQVGRVISKTGQTIDPVQQTMRVPLAVGSKGTSLLADASGYFTGTGGKHIREAATASEGSIPFLRGTEESTALRGHMSGGAPATEAADLAQSALAKMKAEASTNYNAQIASLGPGYKTNPVVWTGIDNAVDDMKNVTMSRSPASATGIVKNDAAESVRSAAQAKIDEFKTSTDPFHQSPAGLDDLKQAIGKIDAPDPQSLKVRTELYNKVQQEIVRQFPDYATAMKDYHVAASGITELEKMFSLSRSSMKNRNTAVGKLQKSGRNNVTSNQQAMAQAFDKLAEYEPTLPAVMAGQALASGPPRGLSSNILTKAGAGFGVAEAAQSLLHGHFALSPSQLAIAAATGTATAAATSPRIAGETARLVGQLRAPHRFVGDQLRRRGINPIATTGVSAGLLDDLYDAQELRQ